MSSKEHAGKGSGAPYSCQSANGFRDRSQGSGQSCQISGPQGIKIVEVNRKKSLSCAVLELWSWDY